MNFQNLYRFVSNKSKKQILSEALIDMGGDYPKKLKNDQYKLLIDFIKKGIQILKNDEVFEQQIKIAMKGFKENRRQISPYQKNVIKTKPSQIENSWRHINRLIKIVNDPQKKNDKDHYKFLDDLERFKQEKDNYIQELDEVQNQIEMLISDNEDLNSEYLEQIIVSIRNTAKRLLKILSEYSYQNEYENLSYQDLLLANSKSLNTQIQILKLLDSDNPSENPLIIFLDMLADEYDQAKDRYMQVKQSDTFITAVEQLYKNLPLFTMAHVFYHPSSKLSTIKLATKNTSKDNDGILDRLKNVKSEKQFQDLKPELIGFVNRLGLPDFKVKNIMEIINGKFLNRSNSDNSATKIMKDLGKTVQTEAFDDYVNSILQENTYDEDDFKINVMEVLTLLEKSARCTKVTGKSSSTRKGKKWMKCVKSPSGGYKRIHWGQAGVRVTGKSGNTKRKKSFRARHKCSSAKPGTPRYQACKDW